MQVRRPEASNRSAFTLRGFLLAVSIVVLLDGAALGLYMNHQKEKQRREAWTKAKTLEQIADTYKLMGIPPKPIPIPLILPFMAN